MSTLAMQAFHRLRIDRKHKIDGTARLVLYHLCWRHLENVDYAQQSTKDIAADLDILRSSVTGAMARLEKARLIIREQGVGRRNWTRYRLPFLRAHLVNPDPNIPIDWHYKVSGGTDTLSAVSSVKCPVGRTLSASKVSGGTDTSDGESVRQDDIKCPPQLSKVSGGTDTYNKNKNIKSPPASAQERAGGPRPKTADDVFRERFAQRDLALLSVEDGQGDRRKATEDADQDATADRKAGAG